MAQETITQRILLSSGARNFLLCVAIMATFCCFIQVGPKGFEPAPGIDSLPAALVFLAHSAIRIRPGILKHLAPVCFVVIMLIMAFGRPTGDIDKMLAFASIGLCIALYSIARCRWTALKGWSKRSDYPTFREAWPAFMNERKDFYRKRAESKRRNEWKRIR